MLDPVQLFLIVRQYLNAMEKKPLCLRSILSIALKVLNDHPLTLYDNERFLYRTGSLVVWRENERTR